MRTSAKILAGLAVASWLAGIGAAAAADSPLAAAAREGNRDAVRALLDAGADPDLAAPGGAGALALAAERGDLEMVDLLIRAGAAVNAGDVERGTRYFERTLRNSPTLARAVWMFWSEFAYEKRR